ncbi:hypothetical protein [Legionella fallonii]|uniref:Uncharacterized protein n=1 Tax=Legionella fallonii LLAP-10 TaxID=1212491 RepID=A0A098G977_9GAMM|nr:hypothetical protein [Legionella fallonii]CEG59023.1 protein of unknown function [Legionella fallonii LLAP-10]
MNGKIDPTIDDIDDTVVQPKETREPSQKGKSHRRVDARQKDTSHKVYSQKSAGFFSYWLKSEIEDVIAERYEEQVIQKKAVLQAPLDNEEYEDCIEFEDYNEYDEHQPSEEETYRSDFNI